MWEDSSRILSSRDIWFKIFLIWWISSLLEQFRVLLYIALTSSSDPTHMKYFPLISINFKKSDYIKMFPDLFYAFFKNDITLWEIKYENCKIT